MSEFDDQFVFYLLASTELNGKEIADCYAALRQKRGGPIAILDVCTSLESSEIRKIVDRFSEAMAHYEWDCDQALSNWKNAVDSARLTQFLTAVYETTIDHSVEFRERKLFAQGGLGQVWRAKESSTGREVALKTIRPEFADNDALLKRFLTEARITARLEHPNIVPVYQFRQPGAEETPYYIMRLLEGQTLQKSIDQLHALPWMSQAWKMALRRLVSQMVQVSEAIAYAHSRSVIHRDLKPNNVMVSSFRSVFVVDWGLAKVLGTKEELGPSPELSDVSSHLTMAGQAVGTPQWMAPEQATGDADARSDVFGLGGILFAILHNRPPHQLKPSQDMSLIMAQVAKGPELNPFPFRHRQLLELDAIARRAMARNPDHRYADAEEFANELDRWLADEPVEAHPSSLPDRLSRWVRHHPAATLTVMSVIMIVGITLGFFVNDRRLALADRMHTQAAASFAAMDERLNHEVGDTQTLAMRLADKRPEGPLTKDDIGPVLREFSRFRPSLISLHLGDTLAKQMIDAVPPDSNIPNSFDWSMMLPEDRVDMLSLEDDESLVFLRLFHKHGTAMPRLLIAAPFTRPGVPGREVVVASFNPQQMFESLIPRAAQVEGASIGFVDGNGELLFAVGDDKSREFMAEQVTHAKGQIQTFLNSNMLETPMITPGGMAWIRRFNLPAPPSVKQQTLATIFVLPFSLQPPKGMAMGGGGAMPFITPILVIAAVLLVILLVVARILTIQARNVKEERRDRS